ncbi:MAG: hypothetical protein SFY66_10725 [Oculatellaceae cyanobacterium bins.114]|nr:hypothetical protein [Oculatellaceae cyanobacterium bins.114]
MLTVANQDPVLSDEFKKAQIPKDQRFELSKKPYCLKLPINIDQWLRSHPNGVEIARNALIQAVNEHQQSGEE